MTYRSTSLYPNLNQQGFTLLELLVVVAIMAIIAGSSIYGSRVNSIKKATDTAVMAEMHNIRKALLQYKTDNFEFPEKDNGRDSPADFDFLFSTPTHDSDGDGVEDIQLWNNDYQKGWRGPYLTSGDSGLVDIGDDLASDGSGKPYDINNNANNVEIDNNISNYQRGIPDPFSFPPVFNGEDKSSITSPCEESINNDQCLLDWRMLGLSDEDKKELTDEEIQALTDEQKERRRPYLEKGRPYLAFDLNVPEKARLVSMGPSGIYHSGKVENSCSGYVVPYDDPNDEQNPPDDLILCLY